MLFFSFFKTLVDQEVIVELKNDIEIKGTLKSVDQFLNLKLDNLSTVNEQKYPHLTAVKTLFVRGSTVRYVHLNSSSVDCTLLQDASRRGMYSSIFWVMTFRSSSQNETMVTRKGHFFISVIVDSLLNDRNTNKFRGHGPSRKIIIVEVDRWLCIIQEKVKSIQP